MVSDTTDGSVTPSSFDVKGRSWPPGAGALAPKNADAQGAGRSCMPMMRGGSRLTMASAWARVKLPVRSALRPIGLRTTGAATTRPSSRIATGLPTCPAVARDMRCEASSRNVTSTEKRPSPASSTRACATSAVVTSALVST